MPLPKKISPPVADFINRYALKPLAALDRCCPHCEYDEAEGELIDHCKDCCHKIVAELWGYREGLRRRLQAENRASKATGNPSRPSRRFDDRVKSVSII